MRGNVSTEGQVSSVMSSDGSKAKTQKNKTYPDYRTKINKSYKPFSSQSFIFKTMTPVLPQPRHSTYFTYVT